MKRYIVLFLAGISLFIQAQVPDIPTDYFRSPMDIPLVLSGTFGELRSDHFHSGIDIKTQQREGLPVYAAADGYVSRIKISHWGYGKALYITHPNGYTTVYGHLSRYNKSLENYIRTKQYEKKSFTLQLFPKTQMFPVKKGQIVAYTGSTGGFVGPHLHYEIRKTNGAKPMNPLLFGIHVPDKIKPVITSLYVYPLSPGAQVNGSELPVPINLVKTSDGVYTADDFYAEGSIGFGIGTYDQLNGASNHNGVFSIKLLEDGRTVYKHDMTSFSFENTRDINLHTDYKKYINERKWIQKCFIEPDDRLQIYDRSHPELGYINLNEGEKHQFEIQVSDIAGNTSTLHISVTGKKIPISLKKEIHTTPYPIIASAFNKFTLSPVTVAFPKNTFYEDLYLDFRLLPDGAVQIHTPDIPLRKKFTLTFDTGSFNTDEQNHLFITRYNRKNRPVYVSTKRKEGKVYTTTRKLGKYALLSDYKPPVVKPYNFYDGKWVSKLKKLKVRISDDLSGIDSYTAFIDGKWIRMEWDLKKGLLVYDFNDLKLTGVKHHLAVTVHDHAGNTKTLKATFYRK